MRAKILYNLHEKHIKGTEYGAIVVNKRVLLCHLTNIVRRACDFSDNGVYIKTKVLKHIYDKKTAEHYDFLLYNLHTVARYPDLVYKNKPGKRGDFVFVKTLKNKKYLCSIERGEEGAEIVTAFRVKEKYFKDYALFWSWRNDEPPHRSTLDTA